MKKLITLLFLFLLAGLTAESANTYLIYRSTTGGTWTNTAGITNPVPVDLSTVNGGSAASLNAWFTDRSQTTPTMGGGSKFAAGDQVWIISGTYNLTGTVSVYANTNVYGGFSGSEQTTGARAKGTNAWDYTNPTIIDGGTTYIGIICPTNTALVDGLTIQNCKNSGTPSSGGGAKVVGGSSSLYPIMQNCIVKNCSSSWNSNSPAGVFVSTYGRLLNSYIYNNVCLSPATNGGGVQLSSGTITGCTIDHNTGLGTGGGLYINGSTTMTVSSTVITNNVGVSGGGIGTYNGGGTLTVQNCTICSNSATSNGGGICITGASANTTTIKNCIIQSNTCSTGKDGSAIYLTYGGTVNNCVIARNTGPSVVYIPAGKTGIFQNCTVASNVLNDGITESNINLGAATTSSVFTNCLFYKSTENPVNSSGTAPTVTYCGFDRDLSTTYTGTGNIFTIDASSFKAVDGTNWSLAFGSTAVDVGTTIAACTPDIAGTTRPKGSAYDMGAYEQIQKYYRSMATGNWSDAGTWESSTDNSTWASEALAPTSSTADVISILNGHLVTITANATASTLNIKSGGQLTLNSGNTLKTAFFSIESMDSGNGTFVDNTNGGLTVSGTSKVQQYLPVSRNWYMSSPISGALSLPTVDNGTMTFYVYPENDANQAAYGGSYWNTVSSGTLAMGTGYIARPSAATSTLTFSGTGLNTGDKTISELTNTAANPKNGYNLIGNPYPSYLNVMPSINENTNLETTVWYRTRDTNETPLYHFETVNTTSGVGTNASGTGRVTGYIPPLQAFWVRTSTDNQTITLYNANRSHAINDVSMTGYPSTPTTVLKAPSAKSQTYTLLGLNVSNGITGDEAIVMFTPEASNDLDTYDSGKMTNSNASIPEIYTLINGQQLAINGMNSIPNDTEIPLGFTTGKAGTFNLKASQISNFDPTINIYLKDNNDLVNTPIQLTTDAVYNFSSEITTNNTSRFALIFRTSSVTTGINPEQNIDVCISTNSNRQIMINGNVSERANIEVFNTLGQKIISKNLLGNKLLNTNLTTGTYIVRLYDKGNILTKKIIVD